MVLLLLAHPVAQARSQKSETWAKKQFAAAERLRETLNDHSAEERTRREYLQAISAYRQVYHGAPASSKAADSVAAVGELLEEMGRQLEDEKASRSAIGQFEFLRKEYPGSSHRFAALLEIGNIYGDDLNDPDKAKQTFEEFLRRYPRHHLAEEARSALNEQEAGTAQAFAGNEAEKEPETPASPPATASSGEPAMVTGIRYWSAPEYTRVAIDLEHDVQYQSQRIQNPERLYFDLMDAKLASDLAGKNFAVDDGLLKQIRIAQFQPDRARIVLDVDNPADFDTFLLSDPARIVIDVHARMTAERTAAAAAGEKGAKKVIVEADAEDSEAPADSPKVQRASRKVAVSTSGSSKTAKNGPRLAEIREARPTANGDRSLIRALGLKIGKIVIDPGHGGHDTGTIGPKGLLEKDLVLDVGRRLGKLLESRLGAEVTFTRNDDTFIPLETRTAIANQEQADLFVSIHANSSRDPDARGVETYYLNFTTSADALEVAARENAVSQNSIHELQDLVKKIALKEKIEESQEFASDVQEALHSGLAAKSSEIRDRGVKKAPFIVLIGANMPSILAEISFVSNPTDERRLRTAEYRQRIAESLYRGISRYVSGLSGVKVASRMDKNSDR